MEALELLKEFIWTTDSTIYSLKKRTIGYEELSVMRRKAIKFLKEKEKNNVKQKIL